MSMHPELRAALAAWQTGEQRTYSVQRAIADGITRAFAYAPILSIDAWRDTDGQWLWNAWYRVGWFPLAHIDDSPRQIFKRLRASDLLDGRGLVALRDDGYNVEIYARSNGEPLFAIEYGATLK